MNLSTEFEVFIDKTINNEEIKSLAPDMLDALPPGVSVDDEMWDLLPWSQRKVTTSMNVNWNKLQNNELKIAAKTAILQKRVNRKIKGKTAKTYIDHIYWLDKVLEKRPVKTIVTKDFFAAEELISQTYHRNTAVRICNTLEAFSVFLNKLLGTRIDYSCKLESYYLHGKNASDSDKSAKLVHEIVLRDLIAHRNDENLSVKDDFFISVFCILTASGLRINECTTLPRDCINKIDDNRIQIIHYPEKGGPIVPRPVPVELTDMVLDSYERIIKITEPGRQAAKKLSNENLINWTNVMQNDDALQYFVKKWAHEWTSKEENNMLNPKGAWDEPRKRFVDVLGELKKHNGHKINTGKALGIDRSKVTKMAKLQEAAIRGDYHTVNFITHKGIKRTNWDTDSRAISTQVLAKEIGNKNVINSRFNQIINQVLEDALQMQLRGKVYPLPDFDEALEKQYARTIEPLITDGENKAILYLHDALLVLPKYYLSEQRATDYRDISILRDRAIASWMAGEKRSYGTKNHEDSVFSRLGIIDEDTDEPVKMTSHDIRHWLNTVYQQGGLSQDQIALIFNRKVKKQNQTYDQTSNAERQRRIRAAIKDNEALGRIADNYTAIADYSRDEAEDYLEAVTRMINPMPHGLCMLDWSTTPCPHHLSCFDCDSSEPSPCEHLIIDKKSDEQIIEIQRIHKESNLIVEALELQDLTDSPQIKHHKRVINNIEMLIELPSDDDVRE
ncbi:MAG: hypothetical protein V2I33_16310 [Kangiellaceae bacterium]|jgi:hypothetical protein|nr:hypothetical protein [Kangiellaceae bacterium]